MISTQWTHVDMYKAIAVDKSNVFTVNQNIVRIYTSNNIPLKLY